MIRHGHTFHSICNRFIDEVRYPARSIKDRKLGVNMKVDKINHLIIVKVKYKYAVDQLFKTINYLGNTLLYRSVKLAVFAEETVMLITIDRQ